MAGHRAMKLLTAVGIVSLLSGLSAVVWSYDLNPSDFGSNIFDPLVLLMVIGSVILGIISFGLTRIPLQRAHARAIAAVFLIIALSVPATFYYADQTSLVGCLGPCGQYFPSVTITGMIVLEPGSDNGTMTVQLVNSGLNNTEILGLTVTNAGPNYDGPMPDYNLSSIAMIYRGNLVSSSNALPRGGTATASIPITNVEAGATYAGYVSFVYGGGLAGSQEFSVQAPN
jgi:hypothetical protein